VQFILKALENKILRIWPENWALGRFLTQTSCKLTCLLREKGILFLFKTPYRCVHQWGEITNTMSIPMCHIWDSFPSPSKTCTKATLSSPSPAPRSRAGISVRTVLIPEHIHHFSQLNKKCCLISIYCTICHDTHGKYLQLWLSEGVIWQTAVHRYSVLVQ